MSLSLAHTVECMALPAPARTQCSQTTITALTAGIDTIMAMFTCLGQLNQPLQSKSRRRLANLLVRRHPCSSSPATPIPIETADWSCGTFARCSTRDCFFTTH